MWMPRNFTDLLTTLWPNWRWFVLSAFSLNSFHKNQSDAFYIAPFKINYPVPNIHFGEGNPWLPCRWVGVSATWPAYCYINNNCNPAIDILLESSKQKGVWHPSFQRNIGTSAEPNANYFFLILLLASFLPYQLTSLCWPIICPISTMHRYPHQHMASPSLIFNL